MSSAKFTECVAIVTDAMSPRDLLALAETNAANHTALKPLLDAQWTSVRDDAAVLRDQIRCVRESKHLMRKHLRRVFIGEWTDTDDDIDVISERETATMWGELPEDFKDRVLPGSFYLSLEDDVRHIDITYKMRAGSFLLDIEQHFHMFSNPGFESNSVRVSRGAVGVLVIDDDDRDVTVIGKDAREYAIGTLLHRAYHWTFQSEPEDPDKALWWRFAKRRSVEAWP